MRAVQRAGVGFRATASRTAAATFFILSLEKFALTPAAHRQREFHLQRLSIRDARDLNDCYSMFALCSGCRACVAVLVTVRCTETV